MGISLKECEVTTYGLKYDRYWCIIDEKKMKPVANHNSHIVTFLRQQVINTEGKDYAKFGGTPQILRLTL